MNNSLNNDQTDAITFQIHTEKKLVLIYNVLRINHIFYSAIIAFVITGCLSDRQTIDGLPFYRISKTEFFKYKDTTKTPFCHPYTESP